MVILIIWAVIAVAMALFIGQQSQRADRELKEVMSR